MTSAASARWPASCHRRCPCSWSRTGSPAAAGVPLSTIVTGRSRNGTDFGIRRSGTGSAWFTAPAPKVEGVYFPGYGPDDAGLDMGDSAITETVGLGAFAMAAAPGIAGLVGKSHRELV